MARQIELAGVITLEDRTKGALKSINKGFKGLGDSMQKTGSMLTKFATTPILGAGAAAIKFASDAEETQAKFNTVFGKIADQSNKWAENFAEDMGRSTNSVKNWMASLQDTFVPLGYTRKEGSKFSRQLTELTVDLASFNNAAESDVLRDLQSALVGNHETMQKYGVIINETRLKQFAYEKGIGSLKKEEGKLKGELTDKEKVMARLKIIMEGTTDAQGDAKRTAGSFANQMRRLKGTAEDVGVEFGKILLPVASELIQKFSGWADTIKDMNREQKEQIIRIAGYVAAAGPALWITGKLTSSMSDLVIVVSNLPRAITAVKAALSSTAGIIGIAVVAFVAMFEIGRKIERSNLPEWVKRLTTVFTGAAGILGSMVERSKDWVKRMAEEQGYVMDLADKQKDLNWQKQETKRLEMEIADQRQSLKETKLREFELIGDIKQQQKDLNQMEKEGKKGTLEYKTKRQRLIVTQGKLKETQIELKKKTKEVEQAEKDLVKQNKEVKKSAKDIKQAAQKQIGWWDAVKMAIGETISSLFTYIGLANTASGMDQGSAGGGGGGGGAGAGFTKKQSGGYIEKEGLYHLHANEKVVPSGAFAGPVGGQGVTINVYGNVNAGSGKDIENFGRQVARSFKLSQMGAS